MTPRYQNGNVQFLESGNQTMQTVRVAAPTDDLGRALMNMGEMGIRLAGEVAKTNDARQLFEAERDMQETFSSFAKWKAENPDETQWLSRWEKMTSDLKGRNDKRAMTADGRLSLERSASSWLRQQTDSLTRDAVEQTAFRARTAGENSINAALADGNLDAALAGVDLLERGNVVLPEVGQGMRMEIVRKHKTATAEKEFQSLGMLAETDPARARELAAEGVKSGRITDLQRFNIDEAAQRAEKRQRADAYSDYRRRIGVGDPPSADELKADTRLGELDRVELATLATSQPSNDGEAFQRAITQIDSYTPTANDELERAKFEAYLESNFSGPFLDSLRNRWQARTTGTGEDRVRTTEVFQAIDNAAFESQLLGEYKKPKVDESGKPLYRKEKGLFFKRDGFFSVVEEQQPDQEVPVFEEDPAKKAEILKLVSEVKETLGREIKAGTIKNATEAFERASQLIRVPLNARAASEAVPPATLLLPPKPAGALPDINSILSKHAQNSGK